MKSQKAKILDQKLVMARASFVHNSPRKLRLIADAVRELTPTVAIAQLKLLRNAAAKPLLSVYLQALGNAKSNMKYSSTNMVTESLEIQEGPRGAKKPDVHAHGARFDRGIRRKRMAHIMLVLKQKEKTNGPEN